MLKINHHKIVKVANWWGDKFPLMACEEMGELIQAISKVERSKPTHKSRYALIYEVEDEQLRSNLVEELADVAISVNAIAYRYNITDEELNKAIHKKLYSKMHQACGEGS